VIVGFFLTVSVNHTLALSGRMVIWLAESRQGALVYIHVAYIGSPGEHICACLADGSWLCIGGAYGYPGRASFLRDLTPCEVVMQA
jgi:hypothetical protein